MFLMVKYVVIAHAQTSMIPQLLLLMMFISNIGALYMWWWKDTLLRNWCIATECGCYARIGCEMQSSEHSLFSKIDSCLSQSVCVCHSNVYVCDSPLSLVYNKLIDFHDQFSKFAAFQALLHVCYFPHLCASDDFEQLSV